MIYEHTKLSTAASACAVRRHVCDMHRGTGRGSNTPGVQPGSAVIGVPGSTAQTSTCLGSSRWVLKNLDIYNTGRSKIIAGHVLYEPHTFEKDV